MFDDICSLVRIAQISGSFGGGLWPVSLPLFHGTHEPARAVRVSMTISFQSKGDLVNARPAAGVSSTLNESWQLIRQDSRSRSGQSVDAKRNNAGAARFMHYRSALASRQMPNHKEIGRTQRTDHGHARASQCPIPKRTDVIAAIDHRGAMRNGGPRPFDAFIERRIDDDDDRPGGY
ncbi:hypothetical protein [Trinickia symbiotica]|uniref:hypothetical protein n=1 Tax=Trinickia symbiotica TaxID=863227 RepID=UPI0015E6AF1C|nr:hypothetical protein [Trinickia symbiotica]